METVPIFQNQEEVKKEKVKQNLAPIEVFVSKNPQMIEGKLRYIISGSTAIILFAEAENIKAYTVDTEGNLTEVVEEIKNEKAKSYLAENLSKFGTPSDIDISFTKDNFPEKSLIDDEFVLQEGERVMAGRIDGKEYYFESPFDYVAKIISHKYLGLGDKKTPDKKMSRLTKMETVLEAVLQDISSAELIEEIEKKIQEIPETFNEDHKVYQKAVSAQLLADPHKMYGWLAGALLETPEGKLGVSVNINKFPRVKEFVEVLSARFSKNANK